jgi:hypothetical protein
VENSNLIKGQLSLSPSREVRAIIFFVGAQFIRRILFIFRSPRLPGTLYIMPTWHTFGCRPSCDTPGSDTPGSGSPFNNASFLYGHKKTLILLTSLFEHLSNISSIIYKLSMIFFIFFEIYRGLGYGKNCWVSPGKIKTLFNSPFTKGREW